TSSDVLKALFAGVRGGVNIKNAGNDGTAGNADDNNPALKAGSGCGTALDYNTDVTNMSSALITASSSASFSTRGQLAKVAKLSDGSEITQNTDAKKEEIIGKIVNLTKAGPLHDSIAIIVLAQAIRDVGGGVAVYRDLDQNGVIGNANETLLGDDINGDGDASDTSIPETIANCIYGTYDPYADEVMAEHKIVTIVQRDPSTGKWRIQKQYYLDD
ncbi:MAG: hypothetical protein JW808_11165, partial [Victivallales bacterium]|nr:hypothetical protein [Victivallales bacterium]